MMKSMAWLWALVAFGLMGLGYLLLLTRRHDRQVQEAARLRATLEQATRQACEEDLALLHRAVERAKPIDDLGLFVDETWSLARAAAVRADTAIATAKEPEDFTAVCVELAIGRQALAHLESAVLDDVITEPSPCCFFNPNHGPADAVVAWTTDSGEKVRVPSCAADAVRIKSGAKPFARTFPDGEGRSPWWLAGEPAAVWARGWFGAWRDQPVWRRLVAAAPDLEGSLHDTGSIRRVA